MEGKDQGPRCPRCKGGGVEEGEFWDPAMVGGGQGEIRNPGIQDSLKSRDPGFFKGDLSPLTPTFSPTSRL